MEGLALDLDDHLQASIGEVDSPDPALAITDIDLPIEGRVAGPVEDLLEPLLELRIGGVVAHRSLGGESPEQTPTSGAAPGRKVGHEFVQRRQRQKASAQEVVAQVFDLAGSQSSREIEEGPRSGW